MAVPRVKVGEALGKPDLALDRDRQLALFDLLRRMQLVRPEELLQPPPASQEEIELGHDAAYIAMVEAVSASDLDRRHRSFTLWHRHLRPHGSPSR